MECMKLRTFLKEKGQTSVEYILMISVSVSIGTVLFKKLEAYMLTNPDSYVNKQLDIYKKLYDPATGLKKYRLPR